MTWDDMHAVGDILEGTDVCALRRLDETVRSCTACVDVLARHPVAPPGRTEPVRPRPVLSSGVRRPVMLVGQAPGITEYETGAPFRGQAGGGIKALFAKAGLPPAEFDDVVYQTSAVKCFPGRKRNGSRWEDRVPDPVMTRNCAGYLRSQLTLVRPEVVVTLGGFALAAVDALRGRARRTLT